MDKFGKMVREARERRGHTTKQMARSLNISEAFAGHLEHSKHVPISQRVIEAVIKKYDPTPRGVFRVAAEIRNRAGKKWYKEYHAKRAKKSA